MITLHHPSELNSYQIYKQASAIAKSTTRAKNSDWYDQATAIQRQWHLWIDGSEVVSALFDILANRWSEGPQIEWLDDLHDNQATDAGEDLARSQQGISGDRLEELHGALAEAIRSRELGGKVNSLGVILHVADEFAILDPAREYSANGNFEEVQSALRENPQEVLGDSTADALLNTWQLMPCWGVKEGRRNVTVQLSRGLEEFFFATREYGETNNIAIVASGVSAPLETLCLAPLYLEWEQGRGDILVFMYRNFSALAVLNGEGELVQLRSLAHRAGAEFPSGLGEILLNTQTSMGLDNPVVTILPMTSGSAQDLLTEELTSFFLRKTPMDIGFSELDQIEAFQALPENRIEFIMGDGAGLAALTEGHVLNETDTFVGLAEGWATQDFYPVAYEEQEQYPDWQDMQLRKWFGITKGFLLLALIGLGLYWGMQYLKVASTEAWLASAEDSAAAKIKMAELIKQKQEVDFWGKIMVKRSEGWLVMQFLLELFPEDEDIVITRCKYNVTADRAESTGKRKRGQKVSKEKSVGFTREWSVEGYVTPKALPYITKLGSRSDMRDKFEDLAKQHNAKQFSMSVPGRTLNVSFQRKQGKYPTTAGTLTPDKGAAYTTSFTLEVSQHFSADDELAIPLKP